MGSPLDRKSFDIFLTLTHVLDFSVQRHKEIERRIEIRNDSQREWLESDLMVRIECRYDRDLVGEILSPTRNAEGAK